jgi:hypothetical protein
MFTAVSNLRKPMITTIGPKQGKPFELCLSGLETDAQHHTGLGYHAMSRELES